MAAAKMESSKSGQNADTESANQEQVSDVKPNRVTQLRIAVRDYGSTVMVFHITMSLASLGFFYMLIARLDLFLLCYNTIITIYQYKCNTGTSHPNSHFRKVIVLS